MGSQGPFCSYRKGGASRHTPVWRSDFEADMPACTSGDAAAKLYSTATLNIRALQQRSPGHDDPATWTEGAEAGERENGLVSPWMTPQDNKSSISVSGDLWSAAQPSYKLYSGPILTTRTQTQIILSHITLGRQKIKQTNL